MASIFQKLSIALIVSMIAICSASPARLDKLKPNQKSKFLARQEVAEAEDISAQTPYPPAGIQPEVKFALPTEEKLDEPEKTYLPPGGEPAKTYGPPAKTYGPPELSVKGEVEEVANNDDDAQPEESKLAEPRLEKTDIAEDSSEQPEESDEEEPQEQTPSSESAGIEAEEIEAEAVKTEEEVKSQLPARLTQARGNRQKSAKLQVAAPQILQPVYFFNYNGQLYTLLN